MVDSNCTLLHTGRDIWGCGASQWSSPLLLPMFSRLRILADRPNLLLSPRRRDRTSNSSPTDPKRRGAGFLFPTLREIPALSSETTRTRQHSRFT